MNLEKEKKGCGRKALAIIFIVAAVIAISIVFTPQKKIPVTQNQDQALLQEAIGTMQNHRFQYKGKIVGINGFLNDKAGHIDPKYHYGWEAKRNPFGEGVIVGYSTWFGTKDKRKYYYGFWLIQDGKVVAACIDPIKLFKASTTPIKDWDRKTYEKVFK